MKEKVKEMFASFVYALYKHGFFKNQIHVHSIDETINALIDTDNSLVRFGDGEITLISGIASVTQQGDEELAKRLRQVLTSNEDKLLIAIVDGFSGMEYMHKDSQNFWKKHFLKFQKDYRKYCSPERIYYNAFVSRCYYFMQDHSKCAEWFEKIKRIWKNKKVVIVEGEQTHNGVENNLFEGTAEIRRILCPSENAYEVYGQIMEACCRFGKENLFLLSVGATAKPLAYDLFRKGYRVIDIGNLDLEYEWYLEKVQTKKPLKKHKIIGIEENRQAGYAEYLQQVFCIIKK
ncbi:MAG: GT-D fold domain-containing glycosyltransferase [Clostridiales bacterium]|nr:GT-D fold domain-containing glycosyltransferase [Clostridiales bacterium]